MSNIILIGFMGCGKSTVGIRLSYKLRRIVEDTDKLIEKKAGMSIKEIFATKGESAFREMETGCLRELLLTREEKIISTGGGLPMKRENHPLLKELGTVVYLQISPECVWERLKNDTIRPLLQCDDPFAKIKDLLAMRAPLYEEAADIVVNVDGKDMEEVLRELMMRLKDAGVIAGGNDNEDTGDQRS